MTEHRCPHRRPPARLPFAAVIALLACGCRSSGTEHLPAQGALGPYSAAVSAGELVFVSGKIGPRADAFAAEAEAALDAVEQELARLDLGLADVVSATVYLTDMALYGELNAVYARRVPAPHPARVCVAVAALPANARVEIAVVARRR